MANWFDKLSEKAKIAYLRAHPNSKYNKRMQKHDAASDGRSYLKGQRAKMAAKRGVTKVPRGWNETKFRRTNFVNTGTTLNKRGK